MRRVQKKFPSVMPSQAYFFYAIKIMFALKRISFASLCRKNTLKTA